ncbi:hypothetical protein HPB50_015769 [Hyalomma asiaticum]|uniref:Uncharacterized protein n=1 Tax=Hyalomma asiaticum TaxID=266040 RepID=A0ACB7SWQ1_HYAAI|nr:hypothetical protein HPB50_015769 [Hyalomma asiaticum]
MAATKVSLCLLLSLLPAAHCLTKQPHIVFILADDLGWNDVSFHGSSQIPTPNLDALAADGVILNSFYTQPACTPSRSAFMTGLYPIRTGLQGRALDIGDPWGLPLDLRILPEHLKDLGYETHIVGKWALGYYETSYTPTCRGFDSFYGFYGGEEDYYTHSVTYKNHSGLDFWLNREPLWSANGSYSTTLYTQRAQKLIRERNKSKPLFLFLSHQSPHGAGEHEPFQAPKENVDKFPYIGEKNRTIYAGMVDSLDQSVGEVVKALSDADMLNNTVIIFCSDNGGQPFGTHTTRSINWPLRGSKGTVWEGGTRVPAFVWSPLLTNTRRVSNQLIHITDWLPTLYSMGGGKAHTLGKLDGFDMWEPLRSGVGSPRVQMLYNIDYRLFNASALRLCHYKLVLDGTGFMSERFPRPGGSRPSHDLDELLEQSTAAKVLRGFYKKDRLHFPENWRERATLNCPVPPKAHFRAKDGVHLFDIIRDPFFRKHLLQYITQRGKGEGGGVYFGRLLHWCLSATGDTEVQIVKVLKKRIDDYQAMALPVKFEPKDPASFPEHHNRTWAPWAGATC